MGSEEKSEQATHSQKPEGGERGVNSERAPEDGLCCRGLTVWPPSASASMEDCPVCVQSGSPALLSSQAGTRLKQGFS